MSSLTLNPAIKLLKVTGLSYIIIFSYVAVAATLFFIVPELANSDPVIKNLAITASEEIVKTGYGLYLAAIFNFPLASVAFGFAFGILEAIFKFSSGGFTNPTAGSIYGMTLHLLFGFIAVLGYGKSKKIKIGIVLLNTTIHMTLNHLLIIGFIQ